MLYFFWKNKIKKVIKLYFSNQDFFSSPQWVSVHVVRCPSLLLPSPSYLFLALGWANKQTVCPLTASQRCHLHLIPPKWGTLCVLCARRLAEQTAWLLPKDRQCKGAWDWNADTLCSSAVIKGNAGNNRPIFTSTWRLQERQRHRLNARQRSGQKNMKMWMCKLLPGIFFYLDFTFVTSKRVSVISPFSVLNTTEWSVERCTVYLIFSRALWTWIHFPSTKNFKSEISGLSNSFFKDCATVR